MHIDLPEKRYYKIGEVAKAFSVNTSLIRFWEKEFEIIKPKINPANPATTGIIMSSIVLIWLYKKTYTSEVYINSIMTCIELTN